MSEQAVTGHKDMKDMHEAQADLVELIQEADMALVQLEQARGAVEAAKLGFELAKEELESRRQLFEQVIARADEVGVPRSKLKKLAEERSAALLASGLLSTPITGSRAAPGGATKSKSPRKPKESRKESKNPEDRFTSDLAGIESPSLPDEAPVFN